MGREKYNDFIVYLNDDDSKRQAYCKIIESEFFVVFETIAGRSISIPRERVLKIKHGGSK